MQVPRFVAAARMSRLIIGRTSARVPVAIAAAALALALPVCARAATGIGPAPDCGCGHVMQYSYDGSTAAATGSDSYLVFIPDGYTGRRRVPLVVVTHGSNTTAAEQEAANNYDQVAERDGFIVMYPDDNDDLHPGPVAWGQSVGAVWQTDVALIAGMTRATMASYRIDSQRVYEIGMSAGAIVTSDLAATYPDLYAAVGIMAGAPFSGFAACETGQDPAAGGYDPQLLADSHGAYQAEGSHKRVMPVVVLNGDADGTVNPVCDQLAVEQWLSTDNLVIDGQMSGPLKTTPSSDTPGQVPGGYAYTVYNYTQPSGCVIAQHWIVHGMNHDWSGGTSNPAYSGYTDPKGPARPRPPGRSSPTTPSEAPAGDAPRSRDRELVLAAATRAQLRLPARPPPPWSSRRPNPSTRWRRTATRFRSPTSPRPTRASTTSRPPRAVSRIRPLLFRPRVPPRAAR